jgi:hypothetical protein
MDGWGGVGHMFISDGVFIDRISLIPGFQVQLFTCVAYVFDDSADYPHSRLPKIYIRLYI